jgi:hypothetical protein
MSISGSALKLLRAQEHLAILQTEVSAFFEHDPYRLVTEHNVDATEHFAYLRLVGSSPFNRWGLIVGDIVHNLRSALDSAIYEIAVRESGSEVPPNAKVLMMPIFDSGPNYERSGRRRVETLSVEARALVEAIQPYRHPHGIHNSSLWALHEVDNADKHRILQVISTIPVVAELSVSGLVPDTDVTMEAHVGLIGDETPVVTARTKVASPNMKMEGMTVLHVAIKRVEIEDREASSLLMPYLGGLLQEASRVVALLSRLPSHHGELLASVQANLAHDWNPPEA